MVWVIINTLITIAGAILFITAFERLGKGVDRSTDKVKKIIATLKDLKKGK